jgi:hypothetical protein
MTLPTSPSECHAPFTCAAAKRLWPFTETINEIAFLFQDYAASEYIEKEGPTYAAAQEAEYTHLLLMAVGELRECQDLALTWRQEADEDAIPLAVALNDYYLAHK